MNTMTTMLSAISQGDRDAYKTLFLTYFPKVKYFIVHMIKDEFVAEDLSQDIFIKIWESREKLIHIQSFNSYLYQMAKNTVINWYHKEERNQFPAGESFRYHTEEPSTEEEYMAREVQLLIDLTVNKMPEKRKRIYVMSRVEGIKNEEIANQLNITKKTVEVQLNLALREIRKTLSLFAVFFLS